MKPHLRKSKHFAKYQYSLNTNKNAVTKRGCKLKSCHDRNLLISSLNRLNNLEKLPVLNQRQTKLATVTYITSLLKIAIEQQQNNIT